MALAELAPARPPEIDPFWVSRQALDTPEDTIKPGCGWMPAAMMPQEPLRRAMREVLRGATACSPTMAARAAIWRCAAIWRWALRGGAGGGCRPDHADGLGHAGDRSDLPLPAAPGDTVLVDDPCYFNFQACSRRIRRGSSACPTPPPAPMWR
jgi:DNA-binding transcriptional MocR family regulator